MSINFSVYNYTSSNESVTKNKNEKNSSNFTKSSEKLSKNLEKNYESEAYSYESTKAFVSSEEIQECMKKQVEEQARNFEKLITKMLNKQANKQALANSILSTNISGTNLSEIFSNLTVDEETAKEAKEAISEEGYYGVAQTSERILNLAKAIAGDDPKKLDTMRSAVEKGFSSAEKMWGGELPSICKQTYEKVMSTFDEWQQSDSI